MSIRTTFFIRVAWTLADRSGSTSWYEDTEANKDFLYTILDQGEYRDGPGTHWMEQVDGARSLRLTKALFNRLKISAATLG